MAELKPVKCGDRWRIQISWPDYNPRFFGGFGPRQKPRAGWNSIADWLQTTATELPGPKLSVD
jgi:hypothetical protein